MEAKQKICKICNKRYSSGKALGGHMRSHLVKLPLPPKPNQNQPGSGSGSGSGSASVSVSTSPSSSSSLVNLQKAELSPEYSSESQSDQSRHGHVTRRRSKRCRRSLAAVAVAETFSAEDAAWFLIKLSRDKWAKVGKSEEKRAVEEELNAKFKCETCNKVFGSYQALGGHKANHKKMMKNEISEDDEDEEDYESIEEEEEEEEEGNNEGRNNNYVNVVVDDEHLRRRSFQCQFCFKVFGSGQALGGHKKVHFSNNLPVTARISSRKFDDSLIIDLNLPAVADEEEGF